MIPSYITTRLELNDAEFINIAQANKKYFLTKKEFLFTVAILYRVHKDMFGEVWAWAGKKRLTNKNIGVDKSQIDIELKKLTDDLQFWMRHKHDFLEISVHLHHRLVSIHPFNNGNGRWARFVVNIFLKQNMNSFLDFQETELITSSQIRQEYIQALKDADTLNYMPLYKLHLRNIRNYS